MWLICEIYSQFIKLKTYATLYKKALLEQGLFVATSFYIAMLLKRYDTLLHLIVEVLVQSEHFH